jgi:hypothetical protein
MKREAQTNSGNLKAAAFPGRDSQADIPWGKLNDKPQQHTPAPPPVWTRYIDSRLKQFCVR